MMKAKIRGIYTTALTKLLLDNGFQIVQPSQTIKKRFGLPDFSAPPDIKIKDRYDLQGIRAIGTNAAADKLQCILHSEFEDALTRKWSVSVDGIYKGKIVEIDNETVYVDIGNDTVGKLPKHECPSTNAESLLVQVERKRIGAKNPILTTQLKIVGDYAILAQNSKVGVSLKIRDLNKRAELYALGKTLAPQGWGIIWRENSANQPKETLEKEVVELAEKIKILNEKAPKTDTPTLIVEGAYFMDVEFPYFSKEKMDKLRATAAPTLEGHHFYKSCGGQVSAALEMAENLLEKGWEEDNVERMFEEHIALEFPEEGAIVDVEHVKLSGMIFHLGQAKIESLSDTQIIYSRTMRSNGFYDGLDAEKEAGDKAISETRPGEWAIKTNYFSASGKLKGTYININTPVEIYPKAIRYVDLEVDICITPEGAKKILDMEKLEKARENGIVSQKLFAKIKEETQKILETN